MKQMPSLRARYADRATVRRCVPLTGRLQTACQLEGTVCTIFLNWSHSSARQISECA